MRRTLPRERAPPHPPSQEDIPAAVFSTRRLLRACQQGTCRSPLAALLLACHAWTGPQHHAGTMSHTSRTLRATPCASLSPHTHSAKETPLLAGYGGHPRHRTFQSGMEVAYVPSPLGSSPWGPLRCSVEGWALESLTAAAALDHRPRPVPPPYRTHRLPPTRAPTHQSLSPT